MNIKQVNGRVGNEGQFYKGNAHGKGKTFYQNGGIYIGNYKFGKHGFGTSIYSNRDKYVGEYKNGIREDRHLLLFSE